MSSLQQMLAARKAAIQDAQNAGAVPGHTTGEVKGTAADILAGKVAVGIQGSAESAQPQVAAQVSIHELDEELAADALAVFENIRLTKHIAKDNSIQRPIKGYYYVTKESSLADFRHYAKYGLVSEVVNEK